MANQILTLEVVQNMGAGLLHILKFLLLVLFEKKYLVLFFKIQFTILLQHGTIYGVNLNSFQAPIC